MFAPVRMDIAGLGAFNLKDVNMEKDILTGYNLHKAISLIKKTSDETNEFLRDADREKNNFELQKLKEYLYRISCELNELLK